MELDNFDTNKRFGASWGAPICEELPIVDVPVGEVCFWCEEPIEADDAGLIMPYYGVNELKEIAYHHECSTRTIIGSAGHIRGTCSCFGGAEEDPAGMTKREAAKEAVKVFQEKHG